MWIFSYYMKTWRTDEHMYRHVFVFLRTPKLTLLSPWIQIIKLNIWVTTSYTQLTLIFLHSSFFPCVSDLCYFLISEICMKSLIVQKVVQHLLLTFLQPALYSM